VVDSVRAIILPSWSIIHYRLKCTIQRIVKPGALSLFIWQLEWIDGFLWLWHCHRNALLGDPKLWICFLNVYFVSSSASSWRRNPRGPRPTWGRVLVQNYNHSFNFVREYDFTTKCTTARTNTSSKHNNNNNQSKSWCSEAVDTELITNTTEFSKGLKDIIYLQLIIILLWLAQKCRLWTHCMLVLAHAGYIGLRKNLRETLSDP
jgi:hypothetical protein